MQKLERVLQWPLQVLVHIPHIVPSATWHIVLLQRRHTREGYSSWTSISLQIIPSNHPRQVK